MSSKISKEIEEFLEKEGFKLSILMESEGYIKAIREDEIIAYMMVTHKSISTLEIYRPTTVGPKGDSEDYTPETFREVYNRLLHKIQAL